MINSTNPVRRLFISTGEVSGDLQGSLLIHALKARADSQGIDLEISALGGNRMARAGANLIGNTTDIGSIGILEALPFILPTLTIQRRAKAHLAQHPPDLVVLIDYMGPNLSLGSYIRRQFPKTPIVYYIAPQNWVWSMDIKSTKRIVEITDRLLAIFPEEARYFENQGATVQWVGHPLIDRMQKAPSQAEAKAALGLDASRRFITLIPASRHQELTYLMPVLFAAARCLQDQVPDVHFLIPLSLEIYRSKLEQAIQQNGLRATLISAQTLNQLTGEPLGSAVSLQAIAASELAITKSGTVNLEIALLKVPQVVLYRVSPLTAWVAKHIIKFSIPFMSPPNLVQMKPIVPEFLQDQATPENILRESLDLLLNPKRRQQMLADYESMREAMGAVGACDRAAQAILNFLA